MPPTPCATPPPRAIRVLSEARLLAVSQVLADDMGVPVGRLRAFVFAYACLSASWPDKPEGSDVKHWFLTVARNAERHVDLSAVSAAAITLSNRLFAP